MKKYSGRRGACKWLYKYEDIWLPIFLIAMAFSMPVITMYFTYLVIN